MTRFSECQCLLRDYAVAKLALSEAAKALREVFHVHAAVPLQAALQKNLEPIKSLRIEMKRSTLGEEVDQ